MTRILITGAREWKNTAALVSALWPLKEAFGGRPMLVHGGARGADFMAAYWWFSVWRLPVETHPMKNFASPRSRNQHMVHLGADVCASFALTWASGTGMCARMARLANIPVIDYGVSTE